MHRKKTIRILITALIAVSVSLLSGCEAFSLTGSGTIVSLNQEDDVKQTTITSTGSVVPEKRALLSFKQNAYNIRIMVKPGEMVQTGEVLVSSDIIRQTMALEQAKADLSNSQAEYDRLIREEFREVRQSEKDAAFERIEAAQALVDLAEENLEASSIRAPFDGTIIEIYPNSYENVSGSEPVILLADLNTLRVETDDLDEKDAGRTAPGDSAEVFFDALPEAVIKGRVVEISQKVEEGSGNDFVAVIELTEKPEGLRWGMSAYVVITPESSNGLVNAQDKLNLAQSSGEDPLREEPETQTTRLCDDAYFVSETIPDGSEFLPGTIFKKTWIFRNTGTCTWKPDYRLVFVDGDQMKGPERILLGEYVAPGDLVSLELNLMAPEEEGSYFGNWQMRNEIDQRLYDIWVDIKVINTP